MAIRKVSRPCAYISRSGGGMLYDRCNRADAGRVNNHRYVGFQLRKHDNHSIQ